jgi:hypothetical protein
MRANKPPKGGSGPVGRAAVSDGGAAVQTRSRGVHRQKMALALNLRCSVLRARRGPLDVVAAK